jgi:hypothetical protein
VRALVGNDVELLPYLARAMIGASTVDGELYIATDDAGDLVGFSVWMPSGKELFST